MIALEWDGQSGMLEPEDIALIAKLVGMLPQDRDVQVIDLGAGTGTTALAVFRARSKGIWVVSVDVQRAAIEASDANMRQYGYWEYWLGIVSRSDVAGKSWGKVRVDLLLCDAPHDYASQFDELAAWLPCMERGGF